MGRNVSSKVTASAFIFFVIILTSSSAAIEKKIIELQLMQALSPSDPDGFQLGTAELKSERVEEKGIGGSNNACAPVKHK